MKTLTQQLLLFIVILTNSCGTKSSTDIYRPFCKIYDFTIKNEKYKLTLIRDTSGGFPTYTVAVYNASTSGSISINPGETDSARPDALKFDFYSSGQNGFSFDGTVLPDGSAVNGFIKMHQQSASADSISCAMQEGEKLPFAIYSSVKQYPVKFPCGCICCSTC